jgi:mRNA deadenylase 3'-5' endonuclease subunit Ccr4
VFGWYVCCCVCAAWLQSMYPYCPPWALKWSFRRQLIMQEMDRHRPDIVCLQEVQVGD